MTLPEGRDDRGSTIPLILGFVVVALAVVAAAISVGDSFVRQHDLQSVCDGAAAAAAASAVDLDRGPQLTTTQSLQLDDVRQAVDTYLARDRDRAGIHARAVLSRDHTRVTLTCDETTSAAFGALFGPRHVHHTARSSARAAIVG